LNFQLPGNKQAIKFANGLEIFIHHFFLQEFPDQ